MSNKSELQTVKPLKIKYTPKEPTFTFTCKQRSFWLALGYIVTLIIGIIIGWFWRVQ